ncbi:hypothetical protein C4559_06545 [Candidatus Microgenomates bacterium]|nr:MAG: hypothetical protein C4559_06545 [Candidatus Microgenomates bacterium]
MKEKVLNFVPFRKKETFLEKLEETRRKGNHSPQVTNGLRILIEEQKLELMMSANGNNQSLKTSLKIADRVVKRFEKKVKDARRRGEGHSWKGNDSMAGSITIRDMYKLGVKSIKAEFDVKK